MTGIIYRAYLPSGISYIGQTTNLKSRIGDHWYKRHSGQLFHNALLVFGRYAVKYEVIEECDETELDKKEKYWIAFFDSDDCGFNENEGGGFSRTPETKKKRKERMIGNKNAAGPRSEEYREAMRIAQTGKKQSEETKEKIRQSLLGISKSESHRKNIAKSKIGNKNGVGNKGVKDRHRVYHEDGTYHYEPNEKKVVI